MSAGIRSGLVSFRCGCLLLAQLVFRLAHAGRSKDLKGILMNTGQPEKKTDITVFTCGECAFTVGDVIRAAHFRGELEPLWEKLLSLVECEEKAEELGLEV